MNTQEYFDVVVIGSGGAGLRSAIGAAEKGAKTLVVSKGKVNRSGATLLAGANISADIACDGKSLHDMGITGTNKYDSKDKFYEDTIHEGFYLNNDKLVDIFVNTAPDRIKELMDWGMKVRGLEGERGIAVFGSDILDSLMKRVKELKASIMEDTVFTDLVVENGVCKGVILADINSGEIKYIAAKAVVLATGGAHNAFSHNSGSTDLCGEGQAAALRAGAELIDMEMVSYCPDVISYPEIYKGNILPYIFATIGVGKRLNKFGQEFTMKYFSREVEVLALDTEWNKMLMSYAIQKEINSGKGTKRGGVYLSLPKHPTNVMDELYDMLPSLSMGIYKDIMEIIGRGEALVVTPAAHYFVGGIRINERMESSIPGLFAAGECAGGLFGSNRVSAATTEMLIEGAVAGESAGAYALKAEPVKACEDIVWHLCEQLQKPFGNTGGKSPRELIQAMHKVTSKGLSVLKNEEDMTTAFDETLSLLNTELPNVTFSSKSKIYNREWQDFLQLRSSLVVAGAILKSALLRKESRGCHIRTDYLYTDNDEFLKNIVIKDILFNTEMENVKNNFCTDKGKVAYQKYIEEVVTRLS